jgi:hypothetical protein
MDVNLDALDTILSDEFPYAHSPGNMETKEEFLSSLRSRPQIYKSIGPADISSHINNDIAVVTGISAMRLVFRDRLVALSVRFI